MSFDIAREMRRVRNASAVMLLVNAVGLLTLDSPIVFAILSLNATVWLARFWYCMSLIHEHALVHDKDTN